MSRVLRGMEYSICLSRGQGWIRIGPGREVIGFGVTRAASAFMIIPTVRATTSAEISILIWWCLERDDEVYSRVQCPLGNTWWCSPHTHQPYLTNLIITTNQCCRTTYDTCVRVVIILRSSRLHHMSGIPCEAITGRMQNWGTSGVFSRTPPLFSSSKTKVREPMKYLYYLSQPPTAATPNSNCIKIKAVHRHHFLDFYWIAAKSTSWIGVIR
jgi:hypothetical protein